MGATAGGAMAAGSVSLSAEASVEFDGVVARERAYAMAAVRTLIERA